jgi:hypothetical protein
MPYFEKQNIISGSLIVDGTIQAEQIAANTVTADKFSGAVEEEYWAYTDDVDVSFAYSGYTNVHTFYFPKTELDIFKGRHVTYTGEAFMNTGTSTQYTGNLFLRLEAEVPSAQTSTSIGYAVHESSAGGNEQVVSFDGNIASNRIGSGGSIGTQGGNFRTYSNLYYDPKAKQGSDLITNGNFNSGTTNWTLGAGAHSSGYGQYSLNTTGATNYDAFSYQAITTVVGETYQVTANISDGTANGEVRASSAANIDVNNQLATGGVKTGTASIDFEFVATSTTSYILLIGHGTANGQYVGFDNIVVKQYIPKTYVRISTTGGQIVPSDGTPTLLWYHPYGGASAGTYAVVDTYTQSTITRPYSNYFRFNTEAYVGWFNADLKIRLTCLNQIAFGKTVTLNDVKIFMQSRIVE